MTNAEERQQRRDLRGSLLNTARRVFGGTPDCVTLLNLHRGAGINDWPLRAVQEEIAYVIGKGYLARDVKKKDALDEDPDVVFRLTPLGFSLLNGDFADDSISVWTP